MIERKERYNAKKPFLAAILAIALSSCQTNGWVFLEGYQPSDGLKEDWQSVKVFDRWIDPRIGAFLLMEESYLDLDAYELEAEYLLDQKPAVKRFRNKEFPDLTIITSAFLPRAFRYYNVEAPNNYVVQISWQNDDLTFLGCHHQSDGAKGVANAFANRQKELWKEDDKGRHGATFSWFHSSEDSVEITYFCMKVMNIPPIARNEPEEVSLFEIRADWSSSGFVLKAVNGSLARSQFNLQ